MLEYTDECVGCPKGMGCIGNACPHRNVPHFICDKCHYEYDPDELWVVDGKWYCEDCLKELFEKVSELDEDEY